MSEFIAIYQKQNGWYERLVNYGTQAVLVPAQWPGVSELKENWQWREVFRDNLSVVLVKPKAAN